jgi:hypothetical protein
VKTFADSEDLTVTVRPNGNCKRDCEQINSFVALCSSKKLRAHPVLSFALLLMFVRSVSVGQHEK